MGHNRIPHLPRTRRWNDVVALLADAGSSTGQIASATTNAAQIGLQRAKGDDGLSYAFWLLCQIPLAARSQDFGRALQDLGLDVPDSPSAFDLAAGFSQAVESHLRERRSRTDIGEMAELAATESLTSLASGGPQGLFSTPAEDLQDTFRSHSTQTQFGNFAHDFFSRFANRFLEYHLSRELSNHVGEGRRFSNIAEHEEFRDGLELHCRQAAQIVREFAGAWHSKTNYEYGITVRKAKGFVAHAMAKLQEELARREGE